MSPGHTLFHYWSSSYCNTSTDSRQLQRDYRSQVHNEKIPPVGAHGGNELNEKYDITGNEAISYSQSAEILSNALGRRITYVNITEEVARKAMKKMGMEDWLIDALIEFYNVIKSGDASQSLQ